MFEESSLDLKCSPTIPRLNSRISWSENGASPTLTLPCR